MSPPLTPSANTPTRAAGPRGAGDRTAPLRELRRFALTVAVIFATVVAVVLLLGWLGGDGGILDFQYAGFD